MGNGTSMYKKEPKGLKNVYQSGIGAAETILGIPKTMKTVLIVGVTVVALVIVVMLGTAAYGVGSGMIDVNELAETTGKYAPKVIAV
jgi:hypothetical protein